jgi:Fe-S-cluster-containing hydrogenase component 2
MVQVAKIRVFRYDPASGGPRYEDYEVPLSPNLTVIRALFYLAEHAEDPPAFRRFMCNRGQCASCLMNIDGRTRRACTTPVRDGMVLEPLWDFPVVRDLVVDFGTRVSVDGALRSVSRGHLISAPGSRSGRSLRTAVVFMDVDENQCDRCSDKPCVSACWVNMIANLEDRDGRRLETLSAPIRIVNGRANLAGVCRGCDSMPCVNTCPVNAFRRVESGAGYAIDAGRCIGCGLCVTACVGGCIWMNLERGHAVKCDLCKGDPACVVACPYQAIKYAVVKNPFSQARE